MNGADPTDVGSNLQLLATKFATTYGSNVNGNRFNASPRAACIRGPGSGPGKRKRIVPATEARSKVACNSAPVKFGSGKERQCGFCGGYGHNYNGCLEMKKFGRDYSAERNNLIYLLQPPINGVKIVEYESDN